jgi:hypothetical protein
MSKGVTVERVQPSAATSLTTRLLQQRCDAARSALDRAAVELVELAAVDRERLLRAIGDIDNAITLIAAMQRQLEVA